MEQVTLEGGVRKYMGSGYGGAFRPYVGATAGFTHTSDVTGTYSSNAFNGGTGGSDPAINYVDGGWSPTASGVIGAEMAVGPRSAIGVETGIRWSDDLDTLTKSDDRISIPVSLRGRVSF
jgi:hypothetical protein